MNSIVQYLDIASNQEYLVDRMKGRFNSTARVPDIAYVLYVCKSMCKYRLKN